MKRFNKFACLSDVAIIGWDQMITETDDINSLANHWAYKLSLTINKHALVVEKRVSKKCCPWINKELKDSMRTRDKLKKLAVKSKSVLVMESCRQVRNGVNSLNKQLKKECFTSKISSYKENIKDSWSIINELLNKRSKSSNIDILKGSDSKMFIRRTFSGK